MLKQARRVGQPSLDKNGKPTYGLSRVICSQCADRVDASLCYIDTSTPYKPKFWCMACVMGYAINTLANKVMPIEPKEKGYE